MEAIDCCDRGLQVDPESTGLIAALSKARSLKDKQDERERMKLQKLQAEKLVQQKLNKALKVIHLPYRL